MTDNNELGLRKIRRALISVSDKRGIVDFARELQRFAVEIISTGGTAKALRDADLQIRDVADVTGFPELMDGRVKTLHPKIHGGLLGLRSNPEHLAAMKDHEIQPIDLVVVNLYPFEETVKRSNVMLEDAVEQIDIGGPSMIRSAAKNFVDVLTVISPDDYDAVLAQLQAHEGSTQLAFRQQYAARAFLRTSQYDSQIGTFINRSLSSPREDAETNSVVALSQKLTIELQHARDLRYGENPHQKAALYYFGSQKGIARSELLAGKEMSFNNYVDAEAAWSLVNEFEQPACAIIKHTNPAGVGLGQTCEEAYRKALATDPVSAFGGIVSFNTSVDEEAARAVTQIFTEVVVAPHFSEDALETLRRKKNLRVLLATRTEDSGLEYRQIGGGMLVQTKDTHHLDPSQLKVVTRRPPSQDEIAALVFAWTVCKHTKSNAIVYAKEGHTVGVGAGQMSRVDSVRLGAMRAQIPTAGSVLASDAFFPFRDGLDEAAKYGITAVIQPGGSVRDEEVVAAADEHNLAMVFTGIRHFLH